MEMAAYAAAVMTSARGGSGKLSMAFKVRCQQCGKVSQFSQSDAGMTALCTACGSRFTIPPDPGETLVGAEAVMDAAPPGDNGLALPPQPQRVKPPPPSPQPSPLPPVLEIS